MSRMRSPRLSQAAWNNAFNDADGDGVAYKFAVVRMLFGKQLCGGYAVHYEHFAGDDGRAASWVCIIS